MLFSRSATAALAFAALTAAQTTIPSATSVSSNSTSDSTITLTRTSTGTSTITSTSSVLSTVVSASSTVSSSSALPAPTANVTTGSDQTLRLWQPKGGLVMCQRAEFAFTGPAVPKTCGVYVTNSSTYLQQIPLGGAVTSYTAGTFSWLVDVPAGLSLDIQIWVTLNGQVNQVTIHGLVVQESSDNTCLATGPGQNTQSIISYASALNSSPSATSTSSGGKGTNVGGIAGGVVGGVLGLALLALLTIWFLRRRHARHFEEYPLTEHEKQYSNAYGPNGDLTSAQMVAMGYQGQPVPSPGGVVPYQPATPSMLAEPMSSSTPPPALGADFGSPRSPAVTQGTAGLDDPATFLARSTRGR
uniref:Epidermal growth factor receptor-like transmembrane-juxtamembrane segment domain-containing protein n=1 Tax=Rhodotorula toruloides TaxID=5286 RepID=A0A0K3CGM7_RHOTO